METKHLIFDSHAHYDDSKFNAIRDDALSIAFQGGVGKIINCACNISSCESSIALAEKHDFIYAAVGYQPEFIDSSTIFEENMIEQFIQHPKVVAIGEIGLDYHWSTEYREKQLEFFDRQLQIASNYSMPVIIHDRDAHSDVLSRIKSYRPLGVVHCFSGSSEMAEEIVDAGMYIGIGGVITFKNSKKIAKVVETIPLERILLETDAPYLSPEPHRGKINNSSYILFIAEKIAEIKATDTNHVLQTAYDSAAQLFKIL